MQNIQFIPPSEDYILSYCKTFDSIAREKKFMATSKGFPLDVTTKFLKNIIKEKIPYLFLINNDQVIGWCATQPIDKTTGYLGIGILKEYRSIGLGQKALSLILEKSKAFGYTSIYLEVRSSNIDAINFYEKFKFEKVQLIKNGLKIDNIFEDIIKMRLIL